MVAETTELYFSQFWRLKPKIKASVVLVSPEASLLGLQMTVFSLSLYLVFPLPTQS